MDQHHQIKGVSHALYSLHISYIHHNLSSSIIKWDTFLQWRVRQEMIGTDRYGNLFVRKCTTKPLSCSGLQYNNLGLILFLQINTVNMYVILAAAPDISLI